jgi:signal transduction histidine kinase
MELTGGPAGRPAPARLRRASRASARRRVLAYVAAVSLGGLALLAAAAPAALRAAHAAPRVLLVLGLFVLAAELMPLELARRHASDATTMSQPFAFALVLGWGVPAGVVALGLGSALADLATGKAARKVLFNAAQLALALATAGGVYLLAGGRPGAGPVALGAFAVAALTFFVVNNLLVEAVLALASGPPAWGDLRHGVGVRAWTSAMLLGMAPIVTMVAQRSLELLPVLALPTAAVWLASRGAMRAQRERARAEAAAEAARTMAAEQARLVEGEQALIRQLQESDRLKRDLLATVSHELKTPLTVILGTLGTLSSRGAVLGPAEHEEFVAMAVRQGTRLKELIEQLLEAARFEQTGQAAAERPLVDAAAVVEEAVRAARVAHPDRRIEVAVAGRLPVRAAPEAVGQVLGNLVDNAAKYAPDASPIRLEAARVGGLVVVAVQDAGPGVPPAERERIFGRFTQLDSGVTRRAGGVGLGLYIARQLAQAQGGELLLAEAVGVGARFELRLPLAADPDTDPAVAAERSSDPATASMNERPATSGPAAAPGLSWRSPASTR